MANSTADPPTALTAGQVSHTVVLNWASPAFGQIRNYYVWRATGSFTTLQSVLANLSAFSQIKKLSGSPPVTTYTDKSVKTKTTYTYFVTDSNALTVQSGPSTPAVVSVIF